MEVSVVWFRFKFQLAHILHEFDHLWRAVLAKLLDGNHLLFIYDLVFVLLLRAFLNFQLLQVSWVLHVDLMHLRFWNIPG